MNKENLNLKRQIKAASKPLNLRAPGIAVIMAAGQGKRIKSETPKVIHPVWGVPSILRISDAAKKGLRCDNQIIVVGIKALEVVSMAGGRKNVRFAYQEVQKGTGHAVQVAMGEIRGRGYRGNVYVFPGDAGLIEAQTIAEFRRAFEKSGCDMMMLSGTYDGPKGANYYGRIVRVPRADCDGKSSGSDAGRVICILQHKDILSMKTRESWVIPYRGRRYAFSRQELLDIGEFDSGMFAFRAEVLLRHLFRIRTDNVQGEIYLTDLVDIFNRAGLSVGLFKAPDSDMLLGFNDKSTWKRMEAIYRSRVYEKLKNIVVIEDEERFFIDGTVIEEILRLDRRRGPLDMVVGSDCSIGRGVKVNKGVVLGENVKLEGNVVLGENVRIGPNVDISTYRDQVLRIGDGTEILGSNIIKGNAVIGKGVRIETGVNITGSDEYPVRIGDLCLIKGTTYIFGSFIEPGNWIEQSILVRQYVERIRKKDGQIQKIQYITPLPVGMDSIRSLD